ncbi:MAG: hypothetical protein ACXWBM_05645, partial [Chthoniobacterales bacterium]
QAHIIGVGLGLARGFWLGHYVIDAGEMEAIEVKPARPCFVAHDAIWGAFCCKAQTACAS